MSGYWILKNGSNAPLPQVVETPLGNGILFDNNMLRHNMGDNYPIMYNKDRDVRTILHLASAASGYTEKEIKDSITDDKLVKHSALDDVVYQVRLVHKCYQLIVNGRVK